MGLTSWTEVVRGVWLRVSSMKVGRTSMSPLRLMMTRWPGRLYRKHSLHLRATASCTHHNNASAVHAKETLRTKSLASKVDWWQEQPDIHHLDPLMTDSFPLEPVPAGVLRRLSD